MGLVSAANFVDRNEFSSLTSLFLLNNTCQHWNVGYQVHMLVKSTFLSELDLSVRAGSLQVGLKYVD